MKTTKSIATAGSAVLPVAVFASGLTLITGLFLPALPGTASAGVAAAPPTLAATPVAIRRLKQARHKAYGEALRRRIYNTVRPIILAERRAVRQRRHNHLHAVRRHAARFWGPSGHSARHLKMAAAAEALLGKSGLSHDEWRAHALCQTDSLSPHNFPALSDFAAHSLARSTATMLGTTAKRRRVFSGLRLASLKFDHFTAPGPVSPPLPDVNPPPQTQESPPIDWINSAELPHGSLLRAPVAVRELKLRRAGRSYRRPPHQHAAIRGTIIDQALQAAVPTAEIVTRPPLHKLPPITKRRSPPQRWMQVRGATTKCFPRRLKKLLRKISAHYGKPVIIISGYRSPRHNRRVGGARRSQHMRCTAADFRVPGVSKFALARYAKSLPGRGGVGTYCRSGFIHLDVGPRRSWHWSCGKGRKRRYAKRRGVRKKHVNRRKYGSRRKTARRATQRRRARVARARG